MDQMPPFSASLGAMGSLTMKLDELLDTKLKDEVGELRSRMLKLSKVLDPPVEVRIWMSDARELSYAMDNCVDAEADWMEKIQEFKARLKETNARYDRYIPKSFPGHTDIVPIVDHRLPPREGASNPDPVVGLHDVGGAVDTVRQWLTDEDKELKVICIIGAGGIGKTTLAKQLWREEKLKVASTPSAGGIECRAFVRTSKKPDMRRILRSILAQVRPHQPPDANEVQDLIHELTEHLKDKRYFIIIDDLWATSVWDLARRAFPKGGNGSRVITTTEIEDIAITCCGYQSKYIFQIDPLSNIQSKELFTRAVFGSGKENSYQINQVSGEIMRRCAGFPQAIISISSVLANQKEANTVHNKEKIQNNLPENLASDEIPYQVLNFCFNCLPTCLQTCLLYLSLYPENYMILKEDIMKQWVAEGFIPASIYSEKLKIAGSYFDKLVNMGLIQRIDVDYSDGVLYYAVNHTVHNLITSKSIEDNFVTVIDYSQRTVRFTNKVSRLSLHFGSATNATIPASTGLSQVRSVAFIGLMSCLPSLFNFKLLRFLRFLILHIWADQPSKVVDLKRTSELVLLKSLHVTCNGTVHLPDLKQESPEHLETLEINARVADIPANIVHLRSWLHLRLRVGTELPDMTGVLTNVNLNPSSAAILLDESTSPPDSVQTIQLLPPICRIPKWIEQLSNLCILKVVVRELQRDDINKLQRLPLTVLSLYVQRRDSTEPISFIAGSFVALGYFEFTCGVLRLMFHKGTMPNLKRLRLGFNAHRGEQYGCSLLGIEDLSNVQEISAIIGVAMDAEKYDFEAAESEFMKALRNHHSNISVKRGDTVEEDGPTETQHVIREKDASSEEPANSKQESCMVEEEPKEHMSLEPLEILASQESETSIEAESTTRSLDGRDKSEEKGQTPFEARSSTHSLVVRDKEAPSDVKKSGLSSWIPFHLVAPVFDFISNQDKKQSGLVQKFTYSELEKATGNFAEKIGEDAFGTVYKGVVMLQDREKAVAIKKQYLATSSNEARTAFYKEIDIMSPLNHCNIIRLVGWCERDNLMLVRKRDNLMLVYELVENRNLEAWLYGTGATVDAERYGARARATSLALDWQKRYKILIGIASGLEYLHTKCKKAILHRDIKPANVMLDRYFNAKLCDFGLVTQLTHAITSRPTDVVIGSIGYMDPLFQQNGKITRDSDVYSFGVLLLEVICGMKPVIIQGGKNSLIESVRECGERDAILDAALPQLRGVFDEEIRAALLLGLRCVETNRGNRPTIRVVSDELVSLTGG